MPYPSKLGQPCWDERQVEKVLTITAQTNEQSANAFLAAHSPFKFISNVRNPNSPDLSEEDVYETILHRSGEVQAAIKGEPGTGKSHLVHWLKLRADFEAEHGGEAAKRLVRILVQRGNGSLKDALRQIVEKLGAGFADHLRQVQGAIDKVSSETVKATLLAELSLEIEPRWKERPTRPPLPKSLKMLATALQSQGVRRWLSRQGGMIDQASRRLTKGALPSDQDQWPQFTSEDLTPPPEFLFRAENSENVRDLFDDFNVEPALRERAVEVLNIAQHDAIASLTGLGGTSLRDIFDRIRRDLRKQGKELALFIEDVSVTGFDREVINALEPQKRDDLCRMVAVIGITSNAWTPLAENQKGRFDPVFEVGAGVTAKWSADAAEVAGFTARYLNAIRSTDTEIADMAAQRRERSGEGADVPVSKCDGCHVRPSCHAAFDKVTLPNGVEIGLFPFTPRAPQALLQGLSEEAERTGVRRSQRGLIENVLIPVLQNSRAALENEQFPRSAALPVRMALPASWTAFTNSYGTGRWAGPDRDRLQLLAEYWAGGDDEDELAARLQPLLDPLGLPQLLRAPKAVRKRDATEQKAEAGTNKPQPAVSPELQRKLQVIEQWSRGERLPGDGEVRELVSGLLNRGIVWADRRELPISESKGTVGSTNFVRIDGQVGASNRQKYQAKVYDLPRNSDTRELLEALLHFKIAGRGTWDFAHGELYKRQVWRWLRQHRDEVMAAVKPDAGVSPVAAVSTAARALAIGAVLRDRKALPEDKQERLARLFAPVWLDDARPVALDHPLRELIVDLEQRHTRLREFVIAELGAGQGEAAPKDYLDPRPLLTALEEGEASSSWTALPPEFHQGHWQNRFVAVRGLGVFADLPARLAAERVKADGMVRELRVLLEECGADLSGDLRAGVEAWLGEFAELIEVQRGSGKVRKFKFDVPHPDFDSIWAERHFQTQPAREKLAATLANTQALLAEEQNLDRWLSFDPQPLRRLQNLLSVAQLHLQKIDDLVTGNEDNLTAIGGGDQDALVAELAALAGVPTSTESTASDHADE